jgi:hypothetical protein
MLALSSHLRLRLEVSKAGRTPACVKTCNSQDTMSATWCKERSTVETNEIMKTAAHRSESRCWRQLLSLLSRVLMLVLTQLVCGRPNLWVVVSGTTLRHKVKKIKIKYNNLSSNIWNRHFQHYHLITLIGHKYMKRIKEKTLGQQRCTSLS